ncbi:MAG: lecithin retinol acyltransferase family protein [Candidatus Krumholzibacteria bacterium]|nr:lecithin retinol acyltransferase family protein [Candidatus Krumholzibacteria bacterium]
MLAARYYTEEAKKEKSMYQAGTTLKLNFGSYFHYGIADGNGNVIHNSKKRGMVTSEPEADFAEGEVIQVSDITSDNPNLAVMMAERYLGMPYNLIKSNCEHFVRLAHGLEIESTQIQQYLLIVLGAGAAIKSDDVFVKSIGGAVVLASLLTPSEECPFKNATIAGLIAAGLVVFARN